MGRFLTTVPAAGSLERFRLVPTRANGQPAFGCYLKDPHTPIAHAYGLMVLTLRGDRVAGLAGFARHVRALRAAPDPEGIAMAYSELAGIRSRARSPAGTSCTRSDRARCTLAARTGRRRSAASSARTARGSPGRSRRTPPASGAWSPAGAPGSAWPSATARRSSPRTARSARTDRGDYAAGAARARARAPTLPGRSAVSRGADATSLEPGRGS